MHKRCHIGKTAIHRGIVAYGTIGIAPATPRTMHVIGPDNRETIVLTLPSYRTHMRQTRQDAVMRDELINADPQDPNWQNVESARRLRKLGWNTPLYDRLP